MEQVNYDTHHGKTINYKKVRIPIMRTFQVHPEREYLSGFKITEPVKGILSD